MIVFDLQCENGHKFEGWFQDGKAYEDQQRRGLIACPVCNTSQVARLPSTFAIKNQSPAGRPAKHTPASINLESLARRMAEFVDKHFDNVGTDFAKEALKIHYGVAEPRNIRGVSTAQEEDTLRQEGIQFFKLALPNPSSSDSSDSEG